MTLLLTLLFDSLHRKENRMNKQQLKDLLSQLTLDEKIGMIHGCTLFKSKAVTRLGIPALVTSDGPMGVRNEFQEHAWFPLGNTDDFTLYLPCNSALAATFNKELAYEAGTVLGDEARGRGKDMILAPGINVHRDPRCGRNFEYMSEDPYLISEICVPFIKGIQTNDVSACVKHFAFNNQETRRMDVDTYVDERAIWEIYFPGFYAAIKKAGCKSIMGAYNQFRGQYCCHNEYLIQEVLRNEWGFDGVVVSDWGGVHDTLEAAKNGLDLEMSVTDDYDDYYMANPLKKAIEDHLVDASLIDEKVLHILNVMNELNMLDGDRKSGTFNSISNMQKIQSVSDESIILLKNDNGALPLNPKKGEKILVIGDNANRVHANGGGSGEIKALYEISPLLGIKMLLGGNYEVTYEPGYYTRVVGNVWGREVSENWQATSLDQSLDLAIKQNKVLPDDVIDHLNKEYLERALSACDDADHVIYIGGLNHDYDVEAQDKDSLKLPYGQDRIIEKLLEKRRDMIIVMIGGSPIDMSSWEPNANGILFHYYNGLLSGTSLANVLFGKVNPSGKLPTTFPLSLEDVPSEIYGEYPGDDSVTYHEGILVGYRHYDYNNIQPLYPFGHGLSYTEFDYSNLKIVDNTFANNDILCSVHLDVTNIGASFGKEVVQLYVGAKDSTVLRPKQELKGFEKIALTPGEKQSITFELNKMDFSYYDIETKSYQVDACTYQILIGSSSRSIQLVATFDNTKPYTIERSSY